jgi:hypothetical protein
MCIDRASLEDPCRESVAVSLELTKRLHLDASEARRERHSLSVRSRGAPATETRRAALEIESFASSPKAVLRIRC